MSLKAKSNTFFDLLNIWSHCLVRLVLNHIIFVAKQVLKVQPVFFYWHHNTMSCCSFYCLVHWYLINCQWPLHLIYISRHCHKGHLSPLLASVMARTVECPSNWFRKYFFFYFRHINVKHKWRSRWSRLNMEVSYFSMHFWIKGIIMKAKNQKVE